MKHLLRNKQLFINRKDATNSKHLFINKIDEGALKISERN